MDSSSAKKYFNSVCAFLKELWENPRNVGAICPSSSYLAAGIAKEIQLKSDEVVIELGPGTGVITQGMLKHGIKPEQIICIEYSSDLVERFKTNFSNIKIIQGDAKHLMQLLDNKNLKIGAVVCGLPLSIFPLSSAQTILDQIKQILVPGGRYISFTYRFRKNTYGRLQNFKSINSKWVWLNIPPARVDTYCVKQANL